MAKKKAGAKKLKQKRPQPTAAVQSDREDAAVPDGPVLLPERAPFLPFSARAAELAPDGGYAGVAAEKKAWWSGPVAAVSLAVLVALAWWSSNQYKAYQSFQLMRSAVNRQGYYNGITVDGVPLGGLTFDEALALVNAKHAEEDASFGISLTAGENTWRITSEEVPLHRNTETLLHQAWALGRSGTLEDRYREIQNIAKNGVHYETSMWYDRTVVRTLAEKIVSRLTVEPRDAGVESFNFATRTFSFYDERVGQVVDMDALNARILGALDAGEYDASFEIEITRVEPSVTREQVAALYGRVSSFSTQTTSDENRNTNINLSTKAVNGTVLQPGDVFSFNSTTGQRTPSKGYKEAGAIQNGTLIEEVGGGVCQTSTTLFNAMVRAGLTIVMRNPHAWPVSYINRGEDAMVNWPDKDLQMQNNTGAPVYIIGSYANRKLTFEVYGKLLGNGDGTTYELSSVTTETTPPDPTVYNRNTSLAPGTEKVTRAEHTGYKVTTYLVAYRNGQEISRQELYRSTYKMYGKIVEYN